MSLNEIVNQDSEIIANSNSFSWSKFNNKTVLISGANGYVPSYFVYGLMKHNELYNSNIHVVALCRNFERAMMKFSCYADDSNFELLIQDVTSPISYEGDIHYFIHAASPAGYFSRHFKPADTYMANLSGCLNLLELSRKNPTEGFLFLSSVDIYGRNTGVDRLSEKDYGYLDPINTRNAYSISKLAAEGLCKSFYAQYDIPVRIVRPFQILGNGLALDDGRLHVDFVSQLLKGNCIVLKGDGSPKRTFMYATDAIIGMLHVMLLGESGEVYNVCDENGEASVLELAELMISLTIDGGSVEYDKSQRDKIEVKEAIPSVLGDATKLRGIGFSPEIDLRDGLKRMMLAYGLRIKS